MADLKRENGQILQSDGYLHVKRPPRERKSTPKEPLSFTDAPESFLGMPCRTIEFRVPSKQERAARRTRFEMEKRAAFVKWLANTQQDALRKAGITKRQIEGMKHGFTPHGFNTHHKVPIFGGGTNDFSNLVLIRREPYHDMVHYHLINPQTRGMKEGDVRSVVVPDPQSPVYVPAPQYKFLEKWGKQGRKTYGKRKNVTLQDVMKEIKRRSAMCRAAGQEKGR